MRIMATGLLMGAMLSACAAAPGGPSADPRVVPLPPNSLPLMLSNRVDCRVEAHPTCRMNPARWHELLTVQAEVNARITFRDDTEIYGMPDVWVVLDRPGYGDCEDYAITKKHELIRRGWRADQLRMVAVITETGERHAVLVVATDRGDYVLDNREARPVPWHKLPYLWVQQQVTDGSMWEDLPVIATAAAAQPDAWPGE